MECWFDEITFPIGVELKETPAGDLMFARAIVADGWPWSAPHCATG